MIDKVADLSHQLREVGLPVSVRSTQSAAQIYRELGEEDRNLLKTALRAIYVKDKYDIQLEDISTDDYAYIDYRISEKEQFSIYFFDTSQNILYYCYMINQNEMAKIENLG